MTKIAIMQPYFIPYPGYFRLMQAADVFVIYDCVQFPRRGYVHRNQLIDFNDNKQWLNMPLNKMHRSAKINQMSFTIDAKNEFFRQIKKFPIYQKLIEDEQLYQYLFNFEQSPLTYITSLLEYFCVSLNIKTDFINSSSLDIDKTLKSEDRILAIVKYLNGTSYINSPNGRNLYHKKRFSKENIQLSFLNDYEGDLISVLSPFLTGDRNLLSNKIKGQVDIIV